MLKLHNLFKVYRTDEVETVALNGVNLEIEQGDFVAIMGPSGCGKSTLLNIIGMLDNPSEGDYFFFDENVAPYSEAQRSEIRKMNIGFIFQSFNLIDELTVAENIELALLYHNMPASKRRKRVDEVMDRMGIAHRAKHMPGQLSGGQQQRVAVARAVVGDRRVVELRMTQADDAGALDVDDPVRRPVQRTGGDDEVVGLAAVQGQTHVGVHDAHRAVEHEHDVPGLDW